MTPTGTLFLMYHEIESPGRPLCNAEPGYVRYVVAESDFRAQLESIRAAELRGVSVGEALDNFRRGVYGCITLTFDDGCETDLLTAAPILHEAGFNATFFIVAGFVGNAGFLSKTQLRELHDSGFEIGSHSTTHRHLSDLSDGDLREELQVSKDRLEQIVAAPVVHLSCPNGRWSPRVAQLAQQAGYHTICTSRVDRNSPDTDVSNLARLAIMRDTSVEEFSNFVSGTGLVPQQRKSAVLGLAKRALGNNFYDKLRALLLGRG
jgi:peptidoglycan/xylan/chitin deacetylase (PgdA/CDA1 family)